MILLLRLGMEEHRSLPTLDHSIAAMTFSPVQCIPTSTSLQSTTMPIASTYPGMSHSFLGMEFLLKF